MYVLLVSACEKRALPKTRKILDSYAIRIAERAWLTPITLEGLRGLHAALKQVATRQTAVACYRNDGSARMRLLWTVGAAEVFTPGGAFPIGETRGAPPATPVWLRATCQLARVGGYGHDFGKVAELFLDKLARSREQKRPLSDMVRHEWLSARLQQGLHAGSDVDAAWRAMVAKPKQIPPTSFMNVGVNSAKTAAEYLVMTHHRLPRLKVTPGVAQLPGTDNHVRKPSHPAYRRDDALRKELVPVDATLSTAVPRYLNALERLERVAPDKSAAFWHVAALRARAALVYADHAVSAELREPSPQRDRAYANLAGRYGDFNQPLDGHLKSVGDAAAEYAYKMAMTRFPALSQEACDTILQPSGPGRFAWQDTATMELMALRERDAAPVLVLNLAGTGSGKTRMNAKAACALGIPGQVRFATALNLKSLTLQTGEAFRNQLEIGGHELSTLIGDRVALRLFEQYSGSANTDGNPEELEFEATNTAFTLPDWLSPRVEKKPALKAILGAPVLVSTIDFLIAAGDPTCQAHHADALLRLMHSDLVLDEIDSYDPKALFAVCRLIQIAAIFGRNVICSSATLAPPVADLVYRAFASGIRLRAEFEGTETRFYGVLLNEHVNPEITPLSATAPIPFEQRYLEYVLKVLPQLGSQRYRIPTLIRIRERSVPAWLDAVAEGVEQMHANHSWDFAGSGKYLSLGLVRVANIRTAILVARHLAARYPHARVATYHANDLMIQRLLKERRLDRLLNRHNGNAHIEADPEIRAIMAAATGDVPFILVATPAEEIGRDHDFDWGVIEPSSTQSITQTAGRVNRHRLVLVDTPNIALLQFNFNWAIGKSTVFHRPGLEYEMAQGVSSHPEHDLEQLIDFDAATTLDASLRFGDHAFARYDDTSIRRQLDYPARLLFDRSESPAAVYGTGLYEGYRLRDKDPRESWRVTFDDAGFPRFLRTDLTAEDLDRSGSVETVEPIANAWLSLSLTELAAACDALEVDHADGLCVEMLSRSEKRVLQSLVYDASFGFQWSSE